MTNREEELAFQQNRAPWQVPKKKPKFSFSEWITNFFAEDPRSPEHMAADREEARTTYWVNHCTDLQMEIERLKEELEALKKSKS